MRPVPHATSLRRAPVQRRSAERLTRILDACAALLDEAGYDALSTRAVAERAGVPIGSVYRFFGNKRQMADALARRNLERYVECVTERLKAAERGDVSVRGGGRDTERGGASVPGRGRDPERGHGSEPGHGPGPGHGSGPGYGPEAGHGPGPGHGSGPGYGPEAGHGLEAGRGPVSDWRAVMDAVLDEYLAMKRTAPGFSLVDFGNQIPVGTRRTGANTRVADRLTDLLAGFLGRTPDDVLRRAFLVAVESADTLVQLAFRMDPQGDPAIIEETRALLRAYLARVLD
ncbi:TetR family transcriptional regulator [Streptomyces sp. NBC_00820]|nr:TetR family transcriptional regulator [Streptomyces sp. NBC_00820]